MKKKSLHAWLLLSAVSLTPAAARTACEADIPEPVKTYDMETLELTREWDKTFPQSDKVEHSKIIFHNRYGITLAADLYKPLGAEGRLAAIAVCGVLYAVLYVKGLSLSHRAAYNTLKNLRASLQGKLERQPLGVIQEKGVGALKKMFIDDIDSIELLLAHALPEGLANLAVPAFVFLAMFFVDWKLALLSLGCLLYTSDAADE